MVKGNDQGQPSEGNGSFVVYTGKGTLSVSDGSGTLTEDSELMKMVL